VTGDLTIHGHGAAIVRRESKDEADDLRNLFRIFHVSEGGALALNQVTVRKGRGGDTWGESGGHGILNRGTLTVTESTIADNCAAHIDFGGDGGGLRNLGAATLTRARVTGNCVDRNASGGGLANSGALTLIESAVSGNRAGPSGGGIANAGVLEIVRSLISNNDASAFYGELVGDAGGIDNSGTLTIEGSTISGNSTVESGGGLRNRGEASLFNCTVTGNQAGYGEFPGEGEGIQNAGALALRNTIVADQDQGEDCGGDPVASRGYNLDGDGSCGLDQPTDLSGADPRLGLLRDNGGPTETHALLAGSPAVDRGSCPTSFFDQRGLPRHVDAPGIANADDACDVGAFEAQAGTALGGVSGIVTSAATGRPLAAAIALLPTAKTATTWPETGAYGLWWTEGSYTLQVSATDYLGETAPVTLSASSPATQSWALRTVELVSFAGEAGEGQVTLSWETTREAGNAGFNVWRARSAGGTYAQLNATPIAGAGAGAFYGYTDDTVWPGRTYFYKLDQVDVHGGHTWHGPVQVAVTGGEVRVYLPLAIR
jgi:hypothetical protein